MKDLPNKLRIKATMIELGERIAWGSEAVLMHAAARRISELEAELAKLREGQEPVAISDVTHLFIQQVIEDTYAGETFDAEDQRFVDDLNSLLGPLYASPVAQQKVVMPEPFPEHNNSLSAWDAGYESGYNDALSLVSKRLNGGKP